MEKGSGPGRGKNGTNRDVPYYWEESWDGWEPCLGHKKGGFS